MIKRIFILLALMLASAPAYSQTISADAVRKIITMRGYKAFYDASGSLALYPSDIGTGNSVALSTTQGYQINNYLFAGGGLAFDTYFCDGTTRLIVPLFAEVRVNFINKRISPFLRVRYGYGFGDIHGLYSNHMLGVRFGLKNHHAVNIGLDLTTQADNRDNNWSMDQDNFGVTVGFEF